MRTKNLISLICRSQNGLSGCIFVVFHLSQHLSHRSSRKNIYDGDVVKVWDYDEEGNIFELLGIFEVFYDDELCMFGIKNKDGNWAPNSYDGDVVKVWDYDEEGNIFELLGIIGD